MNNIPDYILDTALSDLRAGDTIETIASRYPEYSAELSDALALAYSLQTITLNTPPAPIKRFKYAESVAQTTGIFGFINMFRYAAIPLVLVIAFAGSHSLLSATEDSLPGQTLYSLKRVGEEARINLTFDDVKVANLQIEITQKRIEEAKQALTTNDPAQHAAALTALTEQTEKTFAAASVIATTTAINNKDSSLLNDLVAINNEQKSLIENSKLEDKTQTLATISKKNDTAIAKLVATVNEQTLVDLSPKPKEEKAEEPIKPAVKGANTTTKSVAAPTKQSETKKPSEVTPNDTKPITTPPVELPQQQSRASAGFIVEPAEEQYTP